MKNQEDTFSWPAIGRIITALLMLLFVWKTFNILILILISIMLATALFPIVKKLHTRLPLILSTLLVVLLLLVPFVILGATFIPSFIHEFPGLLKTLDKIVNNTPFLPDPVRKFDIAKYAQNLGTYLLQSTSVISSVLTSVLTLFFLTFYLIYDYEHLLKLFLSIFPRSKREKVNNLLHELAQVNGQYIRGNLLISLICGVTLFIGLTALQIPFAGPLAIFASMMDLLPLIGSTIGMIPAVIIALGVSPVTAIFVLALYLVYQQVESAFLAPAIYNKALNISPATGFLAVIIGGALYGIIGAFLALPVAASLPAIIKYVEEE